MVKRKAERQIARPRKRVAMKKQNTPFGDAGSIIGNKIGGYFGVNRLGKIGGRMLGTGIGKVLFGSGAYESNLNDMQANSIINPQSTPPVMSGPGGSEGDSVVIRKTEFIQDIVSHATANTIKTDVFELNPGHSGTFPFLSAVARNYEEYRFRGAVFHFKSLSGDSVASVQSGLGYVAIATQYDALDAAFTTKSQIENYSMSQSGKPSIDKLHGIECAAHLNSNNHLYVRPAAQPANSDLRLYDLGKTTIMTSCPGTSVTLGELWVTYDVELFKPKLPEVSTTTVSHVSRSNTTTTSLTFGTVGLQAVGSIPVTVSSTSISWSSLPVGVIHKIDLSWYCAASISAFPTFTVASGTIKSMYTSSAGTIDGVSGFYGPQTASGPTFVNSNFYYPDANGVITITLVAGTVGSGTFGFDAWCNPIEAGVST